LGEDGAWHAAWSTQLLRVVLESDPANAAAVSGAVARWRPQMLTATEAVLGACSELLPQEVRRAMWVELAAALDEHLAPLQAEGEARHGASP
jgi:hypothetical protein